MYMFRYQIWNIWEQYSVQNLTNIVHINSYNVPHEQYNGFDNCIVMKDSNTILYFILHINYIPNPTLLCIL